MTDFRLAILSATGTARKRLIPAIQQSHSCRIVAIQGRDEQVLATMAREYAIPRYFTDAREMLSSVRPDFAYIASPPALHEDHIGLCLDHGVPVLCEKPLCLSVAAADRIASLVSNRGLPVRVAHHLRHQPGVRALHELLGDPSLGKLRRVAMQWGFWLNEASRNAVWKLDPVAGGPNAFYDVGVHVVDLLVHLLPRPTKVLALAGPSRFARTLDTVSALLLCGDVLVELNASQSLPFAGNQMVLDFEKATIQVPRALGETSFVEMSTVSATGSSSTSFEPVNLYDAEVRDFISLLGGGASVGTTVAEARLALQVLEAISQSARTGCAVELLKSPGARLTRYSRQAEWVESRARDQTYRRPA